MPDQTQISPPGDRGIDDDDTVNDDDDGLEGELPKIPPSLEVEPVSSESSTQLPSVALGAATGLGAVALVAGIAALLQRRRHGQGAGGSCAPGGSCAGGAQGRERLRLRRA